MNKTNGYSKTRLADYDPERWGSLPVARFRSRPVRPVDLGKPPPTPDKEWSRSGGNETLPESPEALAALGKQLFTSHPAQIEHAMFKVLREADGPSQYGLWQTSSSVGGLTWVELPGGVYPALTCSSCHSSATKEGGWRPVPNYRFDLGKAKDDYVGRKSLYSTWGPGRVDIAADERDNPIVIADLRAVRFQTHLHRTANVVNSLEALALRVETGLVTAHRKQVRPTPLDAFALAYYLWSLGEEFTSLDGANNRGADLFARHCERCHEGPGFSGRPVTAQSIASPVAHLHSDARGTGYLQTTSLRGVSDRNLLLFGGYATSAEELLNPQRKTGGHYYGQTLAPADRQALVRFLGGL